jgi:hypothetical protein
LTLPLSASGKILPQRSGRPAGIVPDWGNNINAPSFACAKADRIVYGEFRDKDPSC